MNVVAVTVAVGVLYPHQSHVLDQEGDFNIRGILCRISSSIR